MADNNPYVGPASFGEKDRSRFFGRDDEARELSYLLIARPAVLLYAQSGAGKTSLLQAKVVPDLRDSGEMHVLPITRVSGPAEGRNVYVANVLTGLKLTTAILTDALAPFFTDPQDGEEQIPHLLIFDQFEEIFTFRPELAGQRREFFEQLRDCLAAYPKLGLLLSMREDYLADMDSFAGYLPDRLRTRMRMEQLSDKQAEEAIARPAADAGKPFNAGIARRLADDLRRVQTSRKPSADATDDGHALGKYVEPVQLQIVCRQLWSKLPDAATTITAEHIETLARVDDALTNFYRDSLTAVREKLPSLSERTLRLWFGEHLITSAKTRGMVYQGESETEDLPNAAVEVLREKYILRADIRPSGTWYELAHDRLVEPVLADNLEWRARYKNPVADALERGPDHLLTGSGLVEGLRYEREHPEELTPEERLFLQKSGEAAREMRRRRILTGTGALAIAAVVVLAVFTTQWAYSLYVQRIASECDRLAAELQNDVGLPGIGFDKIDTQRAIPACESALRTDPDNPRLMDELARSLDRAGRYAEAVDWYSKAVAKGWAWAENNLGVLYLEGRRNQDGQQVVPMDFTRGVALLRAAAEQNNQQAIVNYTETNFRPIFVDSPVRVAIVQTALVARGFLRSTDVMATWSPALEAALDAFKRSERLGEKDITLRVLDRLGVIAELSHTKNGP